MKQWQPAPKHMALELMKVRWTKENQAPDVVVHLWMWHLVSSGGTVTVRDITDYAGWSKWKSHNFKKEFVTFRNDWVSNDSGQKPDKNMTATPTISDSYDDKPDAYTGHSRARAVLNTPTTLQTTVNKTHKADKDSLADTWKKINDARKEGGKARALKLTDKRRRNLKARLRENTEEDLLRVVDWWLRSSHGRALFLREGGYGVDTLFTPKFDTYLEMAHSDAERVHTPKQGSYRSLSDLLDEALDEPETLNRMVIPFPKE